MSQTKEQEEIEEINGAVHSALFSANEPYARDKESEFFITQLKYMGYTITKAQPEIPKGYFKVVKGRTLFADVLRTLEMDNGDLLIIFRDRGGEITLPAGEHVDRFVKQYDAWLDYQNAPVVVYGDRHGEPK